VPLPGDVVYVYATATTVAGDRGLDEPAELRRRFGQWHDPIPTLLADLPPDSVLRHDVLAVQPSLRRLHHGRVALLGDAGHAMEPNLGQGACLAIEDAVVLAHSLADGVPVSVGVARYSRARVARVARLARQCHAGSGGSPRAGPARSSRRATHSPDCCPTASPSAG